MRWREEDDEGVRRNRAKLFSARKLGSLDRAREEALAYREAAVERSFSAVRSYQQPGLREEIERLRARHPARGRPGVPDADRNSDASLRQRLENLREDNCRLRDENADLRRELALAYGQLRSASLLKPGSAAVASSAR